MNPLVSQVKTVVLVFVSTILGMLIAGGVDVISLDDWSDWRPYVSAGIAAVIVWLYNYLNPLDQRYGVGSK